MIKGQVRDFYDTLATTHEMTRVVTPPICGTKWKLLECSRALLPFSEKIERCYIGGVVNAAGS